MLVYHFHITLANITIKLANITIKLANRFLSNDFTNQIGHFTFSIWPKLQSIWPFYIFNLIDNKVDLLNIDDICISYIFNKLRMVS